MLRLDDNKDFSRPVTLSVWLLMAFQAGYVNVGGLAISGNFVSHVTGTSSRLGMGIADFDLTLMLKFLTILLAFIGGASFVGYFISGQKESGREPRYTFVLSLKSLFFALVLILSYFNSDTKGLLGFTTEDVNLAIIFFLSFCCGIQNSTCSEATGGLLKPTHMTGLSTDVGIATSKVFFLKDKIRTAEANKLRLRIAILTTFIFGGVISSIIFAVDGHYGFFFPFISSVCFLGMSISRDIKNWRLTEPVYRLAKGSVFATLLATICYGINTVL